MKKKAQPPPPPPKPPYPECVGCEYYWFSGRYASVARIDGVNSQGCEIVTRVKCKKNTHYCRHPEAKLYEIPSEKRWFCLSPKREQQG